MNMYQLINIHVMDDEVRTLSVRRHGDVGPEFNKTRRSIRSASPNYVERSNFLCPELKPKRWLGEITDTDNSTFPL